MCYADCCVECNFAKIIFLFRAIAHSHNSEGDQQYALVKISFTFSSDD